MTRCGACSETLWVVSVGGIFMPMVHLSQRAIKHVSLYSPLSCSGQSGPSKIMHITRAYILHQNTLNILSKSSENLLNHFHVMQQQTKTSLILFLQITCTLETVFATQSNWSRTILASPPILKGSCSDVYFSKENRTNTKHSDDKTFQSNMRFSP